MMRNRIWFTLSDKKYSAIYTAKLSKRSAMLGNNYSLFLALASASSVAAWSIWDIFPLVWAGIVTISQVLHIAKPYIPFIKNDKEFMEMSLLYDSLYLSLEKLWTDYEKKALKETTIENKYYEYCQKDIEISEKFKNLGIPEIQSLINKSSIETRNFLQRLYS